MQESVYKLVEANVDTEDEALSFFGLLKVKTMVGCEQIMENLDRYIKYEDVKKIKFLYDLIVFLLEKCGLGMEFENMDMIRNMVDNMKLMILQIIKYI